MLAECCQILYGAITAAAAKKKNRVRWPQISTLTGIQEPGVEKKLFLHPGPAKTWTGISVYWLWSITELKCGVGIAIDVSLESSSFIR